MRFKLFQKLGSLEGLELFMLLAALAVLAALTVLAVRNAKRRPGTAQPQNRTRVLVYGALSMTLSFVLSYMKLFSMPFGGSITLASMLPLMVFGYAFGAVPGFTASFGYALLQIIQGAYIVHPIQFILDYFVAFTALGLAGCFPTSLPLGIAASGTVRMLVSTVSGAVFLDSSAEFGFSSPWAYSLAYNFLTVGVDTILCLLIALLPPVGRAIKRISRR